MAERIQNHQTNRNSLFKKGFLLYLVIAITTLVFLVAFAGFNVFSLHSAIPRPLMVFLYIAPLLLFVAFILYQINFLRRYQQITASRGNTNFSSINISFLRNKTSYHNLVAKPPSIDPQTTLTLRQDVEKVYAKLIQSDASAVVLTGIAGIGKTTLAALTYYYAEERRQRGQSPFKSEALWVQISKSIDLVDLAVTIFTALGEPVPDFNSLTYQNLTVKLFKAMNTAGHAKLIVLDQFDDLLDEQTGCPIFSSSGIEEWLAAINSQPCDCRLLLTSRLLPRGVNIYPAIHLHEHIYKGFNADEGTEFLRKQGIRAADEELRAIVESCGGHPLTLQLIVSIMQKHRQARDVIIKGLNWDDASRIDFAHKLIDDIGISRLTTLQREILAAFSIYREAVQLDGGLAILVGVISPMSKSQIIHALDTLLAQCLLEASDNGYYRPHPVIINYLLTFLDDHFSKEHLQAVHSKAAHHYLELASKNSPPREQRMNPGDVHHFVESAWHHCRANMYREAYDLIEQQHLFDDLKRWGSNNTLFELYRQFFPFDKWHPERTQCVMIYISMGRICRSLGDKEQAKRYLEQALDLCREDEDRYREGKALAFLGRVYADLGWKEQALEYYKEALKIRKELNDREGESWTLADMAIVHDDLGNYVEALTCGEQSLAICKEEGDLKGEGRALNTLGRVFDSLEQRERALAYYEKALNMLRTVGDRVGEAATVNNLGSIYFKLDDGNLALEYYDKALHIFGEVGDRTGIAATLYNLGLAYDKRQQKEEAIKFVKRALNIYRELGDRWGTGMALNCLGKIYEDLRQKEEALKYYEEAVIFYREIKNSRSEGVTLRQLGDIDSKLGHKKKAKKSFEEALSALREIGDRKELGGTLNDLGRINNMLGKKGKASQFLDEALSIFKELGDHLGEGLAHNNLGLFYYDLGKNEEALKHFEQALSLFRKEGDRWGEGRALNSLGLVYSTFGQNEKALKLYNLSLDIRLEVGDRIGEAITYNNLARVYEALGKYPEALIYLDKALNIFKDLDDPWGEGRVLHSLGKVHMMLGEKTKALTYLGRALILLRKVGDRKGKARVFNSLAMLRIDQDQDQALKYLINALRICKEVRDRKGEGWTCHNLGRVYTLQGKEQQAQEYFKQALVIRKEVGDRKGEGWTLCNIGMFYLEGEHFDLALACFLLAKKLFNQVQSPDYSKVQDWIDQLHRRLGEEQFAALLATVEPKTSQFIDELLRESRE